MATQKSKPSIEVTILVLSLWVVLNGYAPGTLHAADEKVATLQIDNPSDVAVDSSGNVYVSSRGNSRILKIDSAGNVTTLAGSEAGFRDGTGTRAQFDMPLGLAVDRHDHVFVIDGMNNRIRRIDAEGNVTTLGGVFAFPISSGLAVDAADNVYVGDMLHQQIHKIDGALKISTIAGSGAQFNNPTGIAVDSVGNVFVADKLNNSIRKIDPAGGVTTLAGGDGSGFADGMGTRERRRRLARLARVP